MTLYLVTTGWQGNGMEGVLVEAADEPHAMDVAADALRQHHNARLIKAGALTVTHVAEHIADTYDREGWRVATITVPYISEFG